MNEVIAHTDVALARTQTEPVPLTVEDILKEQEGLQQLESSLPRCIRNPSGILTMDGKVLLPIDSPLIRRAFAGAHLAETGGHRGFSATYHRMSEEIRAPGLADWVRKQILGCIVCARAKADTRKPPPMHAILTPPVPFHSLNVDALSGLPLVRQFDRMWVAVCRFSKFVFLVPASTTDDSSATARRLLDGIFAWVGLPEVMISDRDPLFTSSFTSSLLEICRIMHAMSVPYRKEANGLAERQMRTLREMIVAVCNDHRDDWVEKLPSFQFAINSAANAATGMAPLKLLLGRAPRGGWSLPTASVDTQLAARSFVQQRAEFEARVHDRILASQMSMLVRENRNASQRPAVAEGDLVFVDAAVLQDPAERGLPEKLRSRFSGPFRVLEIGTGPAGSNIRIQLPQPPYRKAFRDVNIDAVKLHSSLIDAEQLGVSPPDPTALDISTTSNQPPREVASGPVHEQPIEELDPSLHDQGEGTGDDEPLADDE